MAHLVLVRHAQSEWNAQNRFTGWQDPSLSKEGMSEARLCAAAMREDGLTFDCAYTSYLRRAVRTLWLIQEEMDLMWLSVFTDWRLNERHYGDLQGRNKAEIAAAHGEAQVYDWRRGYLSCPPLAAAAVDAPDHRYAGIADKPQGESLATTLLRTRACYEERIVPQLQAGRRVLVVAHGNSLRTLVKHIENIADADIAQVSIPTGRALVYQTDDKGAPQAPATVLPQ